MGLFFLSFRSFIEYFSLYFVSKFVVIWLILVVREFGEM